ncbi:hypothetical protein G6F42_020526 [Rhizopus arrhizus]|nr:hypothetical protein G6F42_020526 [Rhizopus arrhizus]
MPQKSHSMTVADTSNALLPTLKNSIDPSFTMWKKAPRQLIQQGIESSYSKLQPFYLPLCVPSLVIPPPLSIPSLGSFALHLTIDSNLAMTPTGCT